MSNELSANQITHLNYAFANVTETDNVILADFYADIEKHYSKDSWSEKEENVYDNIKQLFLLKKKYRNLKVRLSIEGWDFFFYVVKGVSTTMKKKTLFAIRCAAC